MLVSLSVPDTNTRDPRYIEQLLDTIHKANTHRLPMTLIYGRHDQAVGLYVRYPPELQSIIEHDLPSFYDGCTVTALEDSRTTSSVAAQKTGTEGIPCSLK